MGHFGACNFSRGHYVPLLTTGSKEGSLAIQMNPEGGPGFIFLPGLGR
jgi:hypothetical protein